MLLFRFPISCLCSGLVILAEVSTFVKGQKVHVSDLAGPDDLCHSRSACYHSVEATRDKE